MQPDCIMSTAHTPSTTAWALPAGMRATKATRALAALYRARPEAALSPAEVQAALVQAGVAVNRVTVYRLLDRCAAAGLLHRQIDSARVTRYHLADPAQQEGAPRFECDGCHRQFRLDQGSDRLQGALQQVLRALARSGHQGQSVDIAVHGLCAGCAHPEPGA